MFNAGRRGQGMTEYIIIVALIAIALIVIVAVFGSNIKALFQGANETFKHGRTFTEMSGSTAYDASAMSAKHRTGKVEGT
jgi:pilus assembly protein Flp/PilA